MTAQLRIDIVLIYKYVTKFYNLQCFGLEHVMLMVIKKTVQEKLAIVMSYPDTVCLGLNTNEIQIPYDKHHKVSSLVKSQQNTHNSVKYEAI